MSLSNLIKEMWSGRVQRVRRKHLVTKRIISMEEKTTLKFGAKVHRPKIDFSGVRVRDITRYSDRTVDTISDTDEYLTIDQQKGLTFPMHQWDELQAGNYKPLAKYGKEVAHKLDKWVDADILNVGRAAAFYNFDDGDIAGTDGNPITLSTSNIFKVLTGVYAVIKNNDVEDENDFFGVVDPFFLAILSQTMMGKDLMNEEVIKNGYRGRVSKFEMLESSNLPATFSLAIATNPTADDTVVINGVTFKFVASPTDPGDVDIGASAAASVDNLVAAVNGAAGAGTTYIELSAANRDKMDKITATDNTTSIGFVAVGTGRPTLSETLTAGADGFTATSKVLHCLFGKKGSIDVVMQQGVDITFTQEPKQKTKNALIDALYGRKVFDEGVQQLVDVQIAFS